MGILNEIGDVGDVDGGDPRRCNVMQRDATLPVPAGNQPDPIDVPRCDDCQSTWLWFDAYGGRHCFQCQPPPSPSLVVKEVGCKTPIRRLRPLSDSLATLSDYERGLYQKFVTMRQNANESPEGLEWRALVDVRIECNHWPPQPPEPIRKYYFTRS